MNQNAFQEALNIVSQRRIKAKVENERRYREINKKIPEIAEVNYQLAQTALRILAGEDIEILKRQNLQAQRYCAQLLTNHGYPADYLDIHYTCEKCQDTGFRENRYCECLEKLISSASIEKMNQETHLQLRTFDQFSLEYYKGIVKKNAKGEEVDCYLKMKKALEFCKQYAANFSTNSSNLLFFGKVGVGKTHLSLSIVTEVLKKGYAVIYDSIGNLLSQIEQEHFSTEKTEISTLQMVISTDLLVLDDLGTEFQTAFTKSMLYNIINTRINKHLPTIISINLSRALLDSKYDERIFSRLYAVYEIWELLGEDIRRMKMQEKRSSQPL